MRISDFIYSENWTENRNVNKLLLLLLKWLTPWCLTPSALLSCKWRFLGLQINCANCRKHINHANREVSNIERPAFESTSSRWLTERVGRAGDNGRIVPDVTFIIQQYCTMTTITIISRLIVTRKPIVSLTRSRIFLKKMHRILQERCCACMHEIAELYIIPENIIYIYIKLIYKVSQSDFRLS